MAEIVILFDFDKTIIDVDSDNWVVDNLGFTELFEQLLPTMPWNTLMDRMMQELHANGKTIEDIAEVLKTAPFDPQIITAIKRAHAFGCDLRVVSDANLFFIETILNHHGLRQYFTEINTNSGEVDKDGRLRISPYHDFHTSSHGCNLGICPPNMCKGKIIDRICDSVGPKKRIIYLGDGRGDYCPSLHLSRDDFVMPRKNFPVWDLIMEDPQRLKAEVHEWSNGEELKNMLLKLIHKILFGESQLPVIDCKLETIALPTQEGLPLAVRVPN